MTDQQINQAIAEACGWNNEPVVRTDGKGGIWVTNCPDYCSDLNAMHEAEQKLNTNQWYQYALALNEVCWHWALIHAPPRQRAEAFLRTLGKWQATTEESLAVDQ